MATCLSPGCPATPDAHSAKRARNCSGARAAKTRPKASCEGMPLASRGEGRQPVVLGHPVLLDLDPGIGPADDGTDRDGDDIERRVQAGAFEPGVFQGLKMGRQRTELPCRQEKPPSEEDRTETRWRRNRHGSSHWTQAPYLDAIALPSSRRRNLPKAGSAPRRAAQHLTRVRSWDAGDERNAFRAIPASEKLHEGGERLILTG